jgi:hypothetical protein
MFGSILTLPACFSSALAQLPVNGLPVEQWLATADDPLPKDPKAAAQFRLRRETCACLALAIGAKGFSADSVRSQVNAGMPGPGPLSLGHVSCPSKNDDPSLAIIIAFAESLPAHSGFAAD